MMSNNCEGLRDLFQQCRDDFAALFYVRYEPDSMVIVTPFICPNTNDFVDIYISEMQSGEKQGFLIHDNGTLRESLRESGVDDAFLTQGLLKLSRVAEGTMSSDRTWPCFFIECFDRKLVSSAVFDLCSFIVTVSTLAMLQPKVPPADFR